MKAQIIEAITEAEKQAAYEKESAVAQAELLQRDAGGRGVKVTTEGNRIYIDMYVVIKYGVSIGAVAESLREAVKYKVESFTGMIVDTVNVNVIGVKL